MSNILSIDWSHIKGSTVYDGKKASIVDRKSLLKKLAGGAGVNSPPVLVILEQGCPLTLIYDILKVDCRVSLIDQFEVKTYREAEGIEKTDENDAKIIYRLASKGAKLTPVNLDDKELQLLELYQRYKRYQKARVAMMNMKKGYIRQFGDGESTQGVKSLPTLNPSPAIGGEGESTVVIKSTIAFNLSPSDGILPYDIGIDTLKAAENSCLKKIIKLAPPIPASLKIKGLGPRLWAGIYITANPANFPTRSGYLRYCGLVNLDQLDHKWNRHARMLYHMLADEIMKHRDERFRPIYDQCKRDVAERYPEYTKKHIHNAALNRTATFLAKEIWQSASGESKIKSLGADKESIVGV